jgi:hypothetical protein
VIALALSSLALSLTVSASLGSHVSYVGGTRADLSQGASGTIDASDESYLVFFAKSTSFRLPYDKVNLLEYGQNVSRRYMLALTISPMFFMAKKRRHFLTIGYQDETGKQQAVLFQVEKNDIRTVLVTLEARTGLRVEYQDEEARKAPKG